MATGTAAVRAVFAARKAAGEPAFVGFAMAGYPTEAATVDVLLALEAGGADVIELAVPHSDPVADGPTLQKVASVALAGGASVAGTLAVLREARARGLAAPVVIFGYYNPIREYGAGCFTADAAAAGADALLVVDLPPEDAAGLPLNGLGLVPLVTPTTTDERVRAIAASPDVPFVYCVSLLGVTGARAGVPEGLGAHAARILGAMGAERPPVAVGFGISSREAFTAVAALADGAVVASSMLDRMLAAPGREAAVARSFAAELTGRTASLGFAPRGAPVPAPAPAPAATTGAPTALAAAPAPTTRGPGWYGDFGGAFIPETLRFAMDELAAAFEGARADPAFWAEVRTYDSFIGRATPLHEAAALSRRGGARVWLKREDLAHTGAHKINNALGQALLARRIGKRRIIAETGAGQHGVAVATVCAKLGMDCAIYMGAVDVERQALNVFRMRALGARVVPVEGGTRTLKDAVNEAMRAWVASVSDTHYILGSAVGPHPFPLIVREFQRVIGREAREQFMAANGGRLPDAVVACVGGGSNAIGAFADFIPDAGVRLVGVEAAGAGLETDKHCAPLSRGTPGVLHGTLSMLMQSRDGQVLETHSISAGLDYPGVGPEHAFLRASGRAEYVAASDEEALKGFDLLCREEGIIPALETAHAVWEAARLAATMRPDQHIVLCVSGRGDKDLGTVAAARGITLVI